MEYGFDTDDKHEAIAGLIVYCVYRSRRKGRMKVTPEWWGYIERATKSASKRSRNVPEFIEKLKPKLGTDTLNPRYMAVGITGMVPHRDSSGHVEYIQPGDSREFLTGVLREIDQRAVVDLLYKETAYIVLLVRDRLERERPIEAEISEFAGNAEEL